MLGAVTPAQAIAPKPTRAEILAAIADIDAGAWIDPTGCELQFHWANLFWIDPANGEEVHVGEEQMTWLLPIKRVLRRRSQIARASAFRLAFLRR
jgi:hypothetical protein